MAQQLKQFAALVDDQVRFPALLTLGDSQLPATPIPGSPTPFSGLPGQLHPHVHAHTEIYTYIEIVTTPFS